MVAWLYIWTHKGLSYSRNLTHSIVIIAMVVTSVMLVVGDSIARAFGLVGALAIIRFRTVLRDTRDTVFIFLALTIGIAIGAHHYSVAIASTFVIGLVAVQLNFTGFGQRHTDTGVVRVRTSGAVEAIEGTLASWCRTHQLLSLKEASGGESEYSFEVRLYHPMDREDLVAAIRAIQGTTTESVALEERAEEW
jgi:uncharacterized membrane protein YhiD involved in acid resistance